MAAPLLARALIRRAFIGLVLQADRGGTGLDMEALRESRCASGRIDIRDACLFRTNLTLMGVGFEHGFAVLRAAPDRRAGLDGPRR
ncbi:hypothetical protein BHS07_37985 [Myxococcus xanthus]|nr:hypothetical protein BHS07_37985 [Myxococcus xanthus]